MSSSLIETLTRGLCCSKISVRLELPVAIQNDSLGWPHPTFTEPGIQDGFRSLHVENYSSFWH